jgi:hypothetical protein
VWLSIQTFGVDAFRAAINTAMDLTIEAQRRIEDDERLELVTPASLGILTFRRRGLPGESSDRVDRRNERIVAALAAAGDVLLTSTVIGGRYAVRLCVLNHSSRWADVEHALERVATVEVKSIDSTETVGGAAQADVAERASIQARPDVGWLRLHDMTPADLRAIAPFASVGDEPALRFLSTGREEQNAVGSAITERWAQSRTFYLVRSGRLSVRVDDRVVNTLGPGDLLGEIAAIDWGRDFGFGRTATVTATEPTVLLAFPAAALRELMAECPEVDRAIRRLAQVRLGSR